MQDLRRRKFKLTEMIEGRNAVLEAFRSGKCVDKLFILDGCQDGPVRTIAREARKHDTIVKFVPKERLDSMSETGAHQGVIAQVAAYDYSTVEDILKKAENKGEPPFIILLDNISKAQTEEELAVKCGYWHNFRFNPAAENKFSLDSKTPDMENYMDFLNGEVRYNSLQRQNPEKAARLFAKNESEAQARYEYLQKLITLYGADKKED